MRMRVLAAVLAAFLMLPAFSLSAYASDYFDGMVSVADPPDDSSGEQEDCEIVDVTPRGEEAASGAITVTDNTEPTEPATEPTAPTEPVTEPPTEQPPAETADLARPFTPSGTGETVDNAAETDGKEFFTITTPDENTFYLVIDRQRETENVYLLDAVTVTDLQSLAEAGAEPTPVVATEPPTEPTEPVTEPEPPPEEEKGGGAGMIVLVVLALIGGGAAYYFKIYRPKQAQNDAGDYDAEEDYSEEPDPYGDIGADDWDSDGPPAEESTE